MFNPLRTGATVNFAESIDTVPENIREVAPALFFAVPRIWEKFYSGVALRMRDATWLGRTAYGVAMRVGLRVAEQRIAGRTPVAQRLAFRRAPTSSCSTTSSARSACTAPGAPPPAPRRSPPS